MGKGSTQASTQHNTAPHRTAELSATAGSADAHSQKRMSTMACPSAETYGLSPPRGLDPSTSDRLQGASRGHKVGVWHVGNREEQLAPALHL